MADAFVVEVVTPNELRLIGDLDAAAVATFDEALAAVLAKPSARLVLDLSGVTFLASAGLACLIRTHGAHPNVVLRAPTPAVTRLLEITGTKKVFRIDEGTSSVA
jgi:anti-sigma B factor antagonist